MVKLLLAPITETYLRIVQSKSLTKKANNTLLTLLFLISPYISFCQTPKKIDVVNGDIIMKGGKKTVNKYYTVKDNKAHPNNKLIQRIIDSTANKLDGIRIDYDAGNAAENIRYSKEILNILKSKGFKNCFLMSDTNIFMGNFPIGVNIRKVEGGVILYVRI